MSHQFIQVASDQAVAIITLNRPEVLNSFNEGMAREVLAALSGASTNTAVRAVLITGAGRGFCAGQDLAEATSAEARGVDFTDVVRNRYTPIVRTIREMEKPVICAVNGVAAGAGANLALACDLVIAAEEASFIQSFSKIGLVPDTGGTFFLPRLIGPARATSLMFLGDKLTAARALEWGMIHDVVPGTVLFDTALAMSKQLAAMPTRGLALTKKLLNATWSNDLAAQLALEGEMQGQAGRTADYREGVAAFIEKRKPTYTGR
jgi:2-(1,2-epoxy-1,2-dihydrophenyl)acetyl-CoA isomerase